MALLALGRGTFELYICSREAWKPWSNLCIYPPQGYPLGSKCWQLELNSLNETSLSYQHERRIIKK